MRNSTSIRFAAAAVLVVLGCISLLARSAVVALVCFCIASFLDLPKLSRWATRRWLLALASRLVCLLLLGLCFWHRHLTGTEQHIIFHPVFVVAFGLLLLQSLFRSWRKERGVSSAWPFHPARPRDDMPGSCRMSSARRE